MRMQSDKLFLAAAIIFSAHAAFALPQDRPMPEGAMDTPTPIEKQVSPMPVARDGEVIDSIGSGAIPAVITVEQSKDGIRYLTGGVSDEELAIIKDQEHNFNTRILMSGTKGEYMSEVSLRFVNAQGAEVLNLDGTGPYFFANLPEGKYTVEAVSNRGIAKTMKLNVSNKSKGRVSLRF